MRAKCALALLLLPALLKKHYRCPLCLENAKSSSALLCAAFDNERNERFQSRRVKWTRERKPKSEPKGRLPLGTPRPCLALLLKIPTAKPPTANEARHPNDKLDLQRLETPKNNNNNLKNKAITEKESINESKMRARSAALACYSHALQLKKHYHCPLWLKNTKCSSALLCAAFDNERNVFRAGE